MELTLLKNHIFDGNYQKIIFNFMDTQTKLRVKQVSRDICNNVEFNDRDLQACIDIVTCNNVELEEDYMLYESSSEDPDICDYLIYLDHQTKMCELFIAKYKHLLHAK